MRRKPRTGCECKDSKCTTCFPGPPVSALGTKKVPPRPPAPRDSSWLARKSAWDKEPQAEATNTANRNIRLDVYRRRRYVHLGCPRKNSEASGTHTVNQVASSGTSWSHCVRCCAEFQNLDAYGQETTCCGRALTDGRLPELTRYEFCTQVDDLGFLGVLLIDLDASLSQMRERLLTQWRDKLPADFIFVHETRGELNIGDEANNDTFQARDFVSGWGVADSSKSRCETSRLILLLPGYVEGEILHEPESRCREYKSMGEKYRFASCTEKGHEKEKCCHEQCIASVAVRALSEYLDRGYIGGFLNHTGGVLLLGIEDDRTVRTKIDDERGHLKFSDRDLDQLMRVLDSKLQDMDPPVDRDLVQVRFTPVFVPGLSSDSGRPYVMEIHVAQGRRSIYFEDKYTCHAKERGEASLRNMEADKSLLRLKEDALRTGEPVGWRGLYRDHVSFPEVIRGTIEAWVAKKDSKLKTSTDFVGRDWLFEKIGRLLETHRGVVVVGGPGTGKTAMMKQLVCSTPVTRGIDAKASRKDFSILAFNFATADRDDATTPAFVVQNFLSMFLSIRKRHDLDKIGKELKKTLDADDALRQCMTPDKIAEDPLRAFRHLMQALRRSWPFRPGENKQHHVVICFDGLGPEGAAGLQDLVAHAARLKPEPVLPADVHFVITARAPLDPRRFPTNEWATISLDNAVTIGEDFEQYVLTDLEAYARQHPGNVAQCLEQDFLLKLCKRACGSFLYLDMAFGFCAQSLESAQLLLSLPVGPTEEYLHTLFQRRFCNKRGDAKEWADLRPYLELFCVGGHFTLTQLVHIRWELSPYSVVPPCLYQNTEAVLGYVRPVLHLSCDEKRTPSSSRTTSLGSASDAEIDNSNTTYGLAHKEIGEWLISLTSDDFSLDLPRAHIRLATFLIRKAVNAPLERLFQQVLSADGPGTVPALEPFLRCTSEAGSSHHLAELFLLPPCSEYPLSADEIFRLAYHLTEAEEGFALKDAMYLFQCMPEPPPNLLALALCLAVRRGQADVVSLILESLRKRDFDLLPTLLAAIFEAARKNLTAILCDLLATTRLGELLADSTGGTLVSKAADALVAAAEQGHSECCDLLLRAAGPELVLAQPSNSSVTAVEALVDAAICSISSDEGFSSGGVKALILSLDSFREVVSAESNSTLRRVRDALSSLKVSGLVSGEKLGSTIQCVVSAIDHEMTSQGDKGDVASAVKTN